MYSIGQRVLHRCCRRRSVPHVDLGEPVCRARLGFLQAWLQEFCVELQANCEVRWWSSSRSCCMWRVVEELTRRLRDRNLQYLLIATTSRKTRC